MKEDFPDRQARLPELERATGSAPEAGDAELVKRFVADGDREAFEALVTRKLPMLRRLLLTFFRGCREDAEDVEQEVLVGLFLDLHRFRDLSSLDTFLYRYARNKAVDHLRKLERNRRKLRKLIEFFPDAPSGVASDPAAAAGDALEADRLMRLVGTLPDEDRLILLLRAIEGLPVEEVAVVVGRPAGTVKSRYSRLRKKLARIMEAERT